MNFPRRFPKRPIKGEFSGKNRSGFQIFSGHLGRSEITKDCITSARVDYAKLTLAIPLSYPKLHNKMFGALIMVRCQKSDSFLGFLKKAARYIQVNHILRRRQRLGGPKFDCGTGFRMAGQTLHASVTSEYIGTVLDYYREPFSCSLPTLLTAATYF